MTTNSRWRLPLLLIAFFVLSVVSVVAQSPNTASMIVVVIDQTGAVVKDAKVSVVNTATGDARELGRDDIAKAVESERPRMLLDALRGTKTLLVLDNLESLLKRERDTVATSGLQVQRRADERQRQCEHQVRRREQHAERAHFEVRIDLAGHPVRPGDGS